MYRYNKESNHLSYDKLQELDIEAIADSLPDIGLTPFAQAMPEAYKDDCAVEAYQRYYRNDKSHLMQYTKTNRPDWL